MARNKKAGRAAKRGAMQTWVGHCPPDLVPLLEEPEDRDDMVAVLQWAVAHMVAELGLERSAKMVGLTADTIIAFLAAPADEAAEGVSLATATRLARLAELRFEDRELADNYDEAWKLAAVYIEAAGIDYAKAAAKATEVRDLHRAANPDAETMLGASRLTVDG